MTVTRAEIRGARKKPKNEIRGTKNINQSSISESNKKIRIQRVRKTEIRNQGSRKNKSGISDQRGKNGGKICVYILQPYAL